MSRLIKHRSLVDDTWRVLQIDETIHAHDAVLVP